MSPTMSRAECSSSSAFVPRGVFDRNMSHETGAVNMSIFPCFHSPQLTSQVFQKMSPELSVSTIRRTSLELIAQDFKHENSTPLL